MRNEGTEPAVMKVTYTGTHMEDAFVGAAVAIANGASKFSALARMIALTDVMVRRGDTPRAARGRSSCA